MTFFLWTTDQGRVSSICVIFFVGSLPLLEPRMQEYSFPHFSATCFDILTWNFVYDFHFKDFRKSSSIINMVVNFCRSYSPFGNKDTGNKQFSAVFSMLWQIELTFCISLSFHEFHNKCGCHEFSSIVVGVIPLFERGILEINSFPLFSPICFDILSLNIWLSFYELQIKFECRQFVSIFVGSLPLMEPRMQEYSFTHFSATCFDILTWNLVYDFSWWTSVKFECRQLASIYVGIMPLFLK